WPIRPTADKEMQGYYGRSRYSRSRKGRGPTALRYSSRTRSGQPRDNLKLRWSSLAQAKDIRAEDARSLPGLLLSRRSVETDRCEASRYNDRPVHVSQAK